MASVAVIRLLRAINMYKSERFILMRMCVVAHPRFCSMKQRKLIIKNTLFGICKQLFYALKTSSFNCYNCSFVNADNTFV